MTTWKPLTENESPAPFAPNQVEPDEALIRWAARVLAGKPGDRSKRWPTDLDRRKPDVRDG